MSSPGVAPGPILRRLPVPDCEPPYDDEVPHRERLPDRQGATVQGTLALAFILPSGVPAVPVAPAGLRLVPPPAVRPMADEEDDEVDFGPQPTTSAVLPDPCPWAGRFVQAVVEVLAGDRPVGQLVRWTSAEVYEEIGGHVTLLGAAAASITSRAVVRSVHVTEPVDGVAEIAAMVRRGLRTTAVALRLEGLDGRWQCTALELGQLGWLR
ncbi:MAG: hypothetical protein H0U35_02600 [Sporichthyaceae bacterium]|nr:hypothetical protein [Sporichthyaceae bacterium]